MIDARTRRSPRRSAPEKPEAVSRGRAESQPPRPSREIGASLIGRVLILDEDSAAASALAEALTRDGHEVELLPNLAAGVEAMARIAPDVVVVDPWSGDEPGEGVLDEIRRVRDPTGISAEVVVVTGLHDINSAVECLHRGASDYILKPTTSRRLRLAISRAFERLRLLKDNGRLRHDLQLFAAAQRILETLDARQLATFGLETLCSFTRAVGGVVLQGEQPLAERDLSEAEVRALARLPRPVNFTERVDLAGHGPVLARYQQALLLDLDDGRAAVLVSPHAFDAASEETGLFLARQLQTGFKNGVRFADAEREARRDSLTGLWNAKAFQEAAVNLVAQSEADRSCFSVLFLDVDHFKQVNDRFGHLAGSRLLVELAQVLIRCVREGDVLARYGGDEFTILMPEVDTEAAMKVAERIRETISRHRFVAGAGQTHAVTVCVGVASFPRHAPDALAILDLADRAMYVGKGSMRNAVHLAALPPEE